MRRLLAAILSILMITLTVPACAEGEAMNVMETILSLKEEIPDKSVFDNLAIRSKQELGTPIREISYQWKSGKLTTDVQFAYATATTSYADTQGRLQAVTGEAEFGYLLYLPDHYDPSREYPTILFLHGIGERGNDPMKIAPYGPFQYILQGNALDMIVIAPQVEFNNHWVEDALERETDVNMARLAAFLEEMKAKYPIDESRIYLTGLSMGGRGAYKLACYLPEAFAAVAVCCGRAAQWNEPSQFVYDLEKIADLPMWLIHGLSDTTVDPNHALAGIRRLLSLNGKGDFRLTLYPGVGHASYDIIYRDPGLYHWFSQWQRAE